MKLTLKFFDTEEWSMYATANVFIPLILLIAFKQPLTLSVLILMSIMNMMEGNLLPRILFVGFMNFMLFQRNINWVLRSVLFIISTIIIYFIPYNNPVHRIIMNNVFLLNFFKLLIVLWMCYIFFLIFNN